MNKYYRGVAIVLLAAFSSALLPTFAKFAYKNDLTVMTVLFFRFSLPAVVLFAFLLITKQNIRVDKKTLFGLFLLGGVFNTLQATAYFSSFKYIPVSLAVLISYTYPAFTAIVSFLWDHEPITWKIILSFISCFAGLVLMVGTNLDQINIMGVILATTASLLFTVYVVISNKIVKKVPPLITSSYIVLFSAVGTLVLSLFGADKISMDFQSAAWPWIMGLVIFSALAVINFIKGIEILGPTKASILCSSEPLFGVVVAMILFQEKLTGIQLVGAAGIIMGAILAVSGKEKDRVVEVYQ